MIQVSLLFLICVHLWLSYLVLFFWRRDAGAGAEGWVGVEGGGGVFGTGVVRGVEVVVEVGAELPFGVGVLGVRGEIVEFGGVFFEVVEFFFAVLGEGGLVEGFVLGVVFVGLEEVFGEGVAGVAAGGVDVA